MNNEYEVRGDVTAIFLKRKDGKIMETIIDSIDLIKAMDFPNTWFAHEKKGSFYVVGSLNKKSVLLHRWLTEAPKNYDVDHYNHQGLDNRRSCNLRVLTHAENHQNRKEVQTNNSSGIRGVCWNSSRKKWEAKVIVKRKTHFVGYFADLETAKNEVRKFRAKIMPYSKESREAK